MAAAAWTARWVEGGGAQRWFGGVSEPGRRRQPRNNWYKTGTKTRNINTTKNTKPPLAGTFKVAGAGFEPATSGL